MRIGNLTMMNTVLDVAENGRKWRALPPRFGTRHMIHRRPAKVNIGASMTTKASRSAFMDPRPGSRLPANRERGPTLRREMEEDQKTIRGIVFPTAVQQGGDAKPALSGPVAGESKVCEAQSASQFWFGRSARKSRSRMLTAMTGRSPSSFGNNA